jgi:hypothetical protein
MFPSLNQELLKETGVTAEPKSCSLKTQRGVDASEARRALSDPRRIHGTSSSTEDSEQIMLTKSFTEPWNAV